MTVDTLSRVLKISNTTRSMNLKVYRIKSTTESRERDRHFNISSPSPLSVFSMFFPIGPSVKPDSLWGGPGLYTVSLCVYRSTYDFMSFCSHMSVCVYNKNLDNVGVTTFLTHTSSWHVYKEDGDSNDPVTFSSPSHISWRHMNLSYVNLILVGGCADTPVYVDATGNDDGKRPCLGNGQTVLMRTPTQADFVECSSEEIIRNGLPPALLDDPLFRKVLVTISHMGQNCSGFYSNLTQPILRPSRVWTKQSAQSWTTC